MTRIDETAWGQIETGHRPFGVLSAKRAVPDVDLFLAVDHEGFRHALLRIQTIEEAFTDERSRGLTVHGRELEIEGNPSHPFLDVSCTDKIGHDAFNAVISEILERLVAGDNPTRVLAATLVRWRRFWGSAIGSGLSREQLRGLFGELWFLLVWLLPHGQGGVGSWVGPSGSRHDFQWPDFSVEVKTTESIRGHIHRINGLDQLDHPDNGRLFLFSLRLREEPASTNSLVTLVDGITNLLVADPGLLELFEERLAQAGYSPVHSKRYSEIHFRVVGERLYQVGAGFPRISLASFEGGLPPGVERVEYEINLETCPQLCIGRAPTELGAILRNMALRIE